MKNQTGWIAVLLFFSCCFCRAANTGELHIGRDQAQSAEVDIAIKVLNKAYSKIGIVPIFEPYPLLRSLAMANGGQLDGDTMRFEQSFADYPNLIRIPVPIVQIKTVAFLRAANCPTKLSWDDLQGRYVSYERGIILYDVRLAKAYAVHAISADDTLHLLSQGSSEVAVVLEKEADFVVQSGKYKNICRVLQPLEITPLFHALNKSHADIAQKLQVVLKDMEAHGEINALWSAGN
jgi:hypothetical protein